MWACNEFMGDRSRHLLKSTEMCCLSRHRNVSSNPEALQLGDLLTWQQQPTCFDCHLLIGPSRLHMGLMANEVA